MKVTLVCPSNMLYMPYVNNYIEILEKENVIFNIINWDRFKIERRHDLTYKDKKNGHQRNIFDYYLYKKFIINRLNQQKPDKIIVFGLQLTFFLKGYFKKNYVDNYIIDIRDYNRILKFYNPTKIIKNSFITVISSPAYINWLPKVNKYVVNHNIQKININELEKSSSIGEDKLHTISYIGSVTNLQENQSLILSLKNNNNIKLKFYGGDNETNKKLNKFIKKNKINNVEIYGRYLKEEERMLYKESTFVNMILYNKNINDETAMANRVYQSVYWGKPLVAIKGTYLSSIIKKYNLGIVADSISCLEKEIANYIKIFDREIYDRNRYIFLNKVKNENIFFSAKISEFCSNDKSISS